MPRGGSSAGETSGLFRSIVKLPGLFGQMYGGLMGGLNDPRLSESENASARNKALIMSGLGLMAASGAQPGEAGPDIFSALAQGGMIGQQLGQQLRDEIYQRGEEERQLGLIQSDEFPLNDAQKMLLSSLPVSLQQQVISQLMLQQQAAGPALPGSLRGAIALTPGVSEETLDSLSPSERDALVALANSLGGPSPAQVTVNTAEQTKGALDEIVIAEFRQNRDNIQGAYDQLAFLDQMDALLDQGMPTGPTETFLRPLKRVLADFGIISPQEVEQLNRQDVFRALENRFAIAMRQNMPGQLSDRDVRFLQEQVPRLQNLPGGNRLLIQFMRQLANRKIEMASLQRRFLAEHPDNPSGWFQYQADWVQEHPLFAPRYDPNAPLGSVENPIQLDYDPLAGGGQ